MNRYQSLGQSMVPRTCIDNIRTHSEESHVSQPYLQHTTGSRKSGQLTWFASADLAPL